jgi:ribosomal protein L44E
MKEFSIIITCSTCGKAATFVDNGSKNVDNIDIITYYEGSELDIYCDDCNKHITIL